MRSCSRSRRLHAPFLRCEVSGGRRDIEIRILLCKVRSYCEGGFEYVPPVRSLFCFLDETQVPR